MFDPLYPIYARNPMTGQRHFNFMPNRAEKWIGWGIHSISSLTTQTLDEEDPRTKKVRELGERLIQKSWSGAGTKLDPRKIDVIFNERVPNAYATPGGYIGVHSGMLKKLAKWETHAYADPRLANKDLTLDDKIAAILAHEMAHTEGEHFGRRISSYVVVQALILQFFSLVESLVLIAIENLEKLLPVEPNSSEETTRDAVRTILLLLFYKIHEFLSFWVPVLILNHYFSQKDEYEADEYGMKLLQKAGIDPAAMVWTTHFLAELNGSRSNAPLTPFWKLGRWIHTHPIPQDRIANIQEKYDALMRLTQGEL